MRGSAESVTTSAGRPAGEYAALVARIRRKVESHVDPGAVVLVVGKGDTALMDLGDREAWHFPQGPDGEWAGYHPADSSEAVEHLESLRARGARYLVLPSTAYWWLDHYGGLRRHLDGRCRLVGGVDGDCRIYALESADPVSPGPAPAARSGGGADRRFDDLLDALLAPEVGVVVASAHGTGSLQASGRPSWPLDVSTPGDPGVWEALERMRAQGARVLVVPNLPPLGPDGMRDFRTALKARFRRIAGRDRLCSLYDLGRPGAVGEDDDPSASGLTIVD